MPKKCDHPGCKNDAKSKGKCWWHVPKKPLKRTPLKKKFYVIPKRSKKQDARIRKYNPIQKAFLALPENKYCRCGCGRIADSVHHSQGKIGDLLFDTSTFIPLTWNPCHMYYETHPEEAIAKGLSFYRVKINHNK